MLRYSTYGDPGAPHVLIAHGLFGSGRNWGVIAKRLSDRAYVIAVDMRNHADSLQSESHSYPDMAADLAEIIRHTGAPAHVIGHSMGGKAAMILALTHPDLVQKLIVADIAPIAYSHSQMRYITAMRLVDLSRVNRRSDAEAQLADQGVEPALCSFFTQSLDVPGKRWKMNLDALADNMTQIMGFPEPASRFEGSTLFLSGAASDYVTPQHRPIIKAMFPAARFAKIPGAGHWLHAEKPREFEAAVRAFLTLD
jgi:esterase